MIRRPALWLVLAMVLGTTPGAACAAEDVAALVRRLGHPSFRQREAASNALVDLGAKALPALRAAADDPDPEVRWRARAAARAIRWHVSPALARRVGDAFAGFEKKAWFQRERLVLDLAAVGGRSALPALARVLADDPARTVKRAAAIGLLRMGPEGLLALERLGGKRLGLPADSAALRIEIGNGFLEEGKYRRALQQYRKALDIEPKNEIAWYNLACAYSRMKQIDRAVAALEQAVRLGYDDLEWLEHDPDLDNLRDAPGYQALVRRMKKAAERRRKAPESGGP